MACGRVATDDDAILEWLSLQETLEARYQRSGCTGYVHVMFRGEKGAHLHIDVASQDFFLKHRPGRARRPRPTHKIAEVREAFDRLAGHDITVGTMGVYFISQNKLPPFVQSTIGKTTTVRDVSIKTTGGTLSVAGAPIDTIRWWLGEGEDGVRVQLEAERTATLDDGYLEKCLDILDSAFGAFVLQGDK